CTTLTASGMIGHGHSFGEPNIKLSGTVRPWSTSILLHSVRSNSSRITDCAMCEASCGCPFTTGTGRGPQPSSAIGNSAAVPSAKVGIISTENAEAWSLYTTMQTSGLALRIHSLERSKPSNTRCQYGSPVRWLSIAAPIAGTCDDVTPAMTLATAFLSLPGFRFRCRLVRLDDPRAGLGVLARPAAVAVDR